MTMDKYIDQLASRIATDDAPLLDNTASANHQNRDPTRQYKETKKRERRQFSEWPFEAQAF